jgi:hypothetical protein
VDEVVVRLVDVEVDVDVVVVVVRCGFAAPAGTATTSASRTLPDLPPDHIY